MTFPILTQSGAQFDSERRYRYALWRIWDDTKPWVLFIGLNPSTADEQANDATLIKCIHFANSWGYGGVYMANLFAYRATDPMNMKSAADPIGLENDAWLDRLYMEAGLVVAAWGNHGVHLGRSDIIRSRFSQMKCLHINSTREPAHPLYQPNSSVPMNYEYNNMISIKYDRIVELFNISIFPPKHPAIKSISRSQDEPSIHGDKIWEASYVMMDFLEEFPLQEDSRILEIGCGWGVLTSYLAHRYSRQVTGLDSDASVRPYFDFHARQNNVTPAFVKGTMKSMTQDKLSEYDVIIGGDICFWDNLKRDWQNLIRRAFRAGVSEIYIVDPGRPPFWELVEYAEKHFGGEVWSHEVQTPHAIEQYVLEIKR